jgi:YgiT-type zinc finger domain-containing protein
MTGSDTAVGDSLCETCGRQTEEKVVQVTMWSGGKLVLVENVPAHVCEECQEQFYDEGTGEQILALANDGFPREKAVREITVPVFTLEGTNKPQSRA